ncbi:Mitochondrial inner membrane protease atp23 [Mycoemilia scoparia]|uniref:Mitochondrial inner membrane protease ATP23 n=1 Tax=Mycoemilia scoparia TaxID=417184 RepID=A0A9W8A4K1_9FUNG|nr:Mitochondrial inner membrane protease atp23 [Mycoemilia scoparia]
MSDKSHNNPKFVALSTEEKKTLGFWGSYFGQLTGMGLSKEELAERESKKILEAEELACKRCEQWRDELLQSSPIVKFMKDHLSRSGYEITSENMPCTKCDESRSGGFSPEYGIDLCWNGFFSKDHMEDTMAHEMIHAYDHCNFKVNWLNLEHHACSEIRAASLSGDCRLLRELKRGHYGFIKQHQKCVKRRAILSLLSNPSCKSKEDAERAVNKVFDSCFNDTRPFDEIY